jgi:hypothetical protein
LSAGIVAFGLLLQTAALEDILWGIPCSFCFKLRLIFFARGVAPDDFS